MNVQPDIVFGKGGDRELRLDLFTPDPEQSLRTAVLQPNDGTQGSGQSGSTASASNRGKAIPTLPAHIWAKNRINVANVWYSDRSFLYRAASKALTIASPSWVTTTLRSRPSLVPVCRVTKPRRSKVAT